MSAPGTRMAAVLAKCCVIYRGGCVPIWKWPIGVLAVIIQLVTVANENVTVVTWFLFGGFLISS